MHETALYPPFKYFKNNLLYVYRQRHHWLRKFPVSRQNINKLSQYRFREPVLHDESLAAGRKYKSVCLVTCLFVCLCVCGSILLGLFGLEPVLSRLWPVTHDPRTHSGERSTQQLHPHCHTPWWEGDERKAVKLKMIKNEREREGALGYRASIYSPDLLCLLLKFTSTVIQPLLSSFTQLFSLRDHDRVWVTF